VGDETGSVQGRTLCKGTLSTFGETRVTTPIV
jgi:hypothetical protein